MNVLQEGTVSPEWIGKLTPQAQREFYLRVKESLPFLEKSKDFEEVQKAIQDYERKNGIT